MPTVDRQSAVSTFSSLANETRLTILDVLADAPVGLSFSQLYEAVPIDDTGNFNYHLTQLTGSFVQKHDGVYKITPTGTAILGALVAGTFDADLSIEPIPTNWECLQCGGDFTVRCVDTRAHLRCDTCESGSTISVPPSAVDSTSKENLPTTLIQWYRSRIQQLRAGFCHRCSSQTDRRLVEGVDPEADAPTPSVVRFDCRRCGASATVSGATLVTFHPVVEGFFREYGLETHNQHPTQVWRALDSSEVRTTSENPLEVEVQFSMDEETVSAVITAAGCVEDVRRVDTS
ncbi:hypothetical protein C453_10520 [Haloferax elongans ATCC BAA-1513]|uniref:ArsR family transcriptional regulator n=1 Tax=Haloferax elongans ATCC BAA-1513 TaxID=1230453 RepID=M0HMM7_HALEO|nr:hypothetical protein C453_10520 [Haloferax elongans ATCC BAA-1513]